MVDLSHPGSCVRLMPAADRTCWIRCRERQRELHQRKGKGDLGQDEEAGGCFRAPPTLVTVLVQRQKTTSSDADVPRIHFTPAVEAYAS